MNSQRSLSEINRSGARKPRGLFSAIKGMLETIRRSPEDRLREREKQTEVEAAPVYCMANRR